MLFLKSWPSQTQWYHSKEGPGFRIFPHHLCLVGTWKYYWQLYSLLHSTLNKPPSYMLLERQLNSPGLQTMAISPYLAYFHLICLMYARKHIYDFGGGHSRKGRRKTEMKKSNSQLIHNMTDLKYLFEARLPISTITLKITWLECQIQNKAQRMCIRLVNVNHGALLWALGIKENESR